MKLNPISTGALGFFLWAAMMLLIKYPQGWLSLTSTPVLLILVSSIYSLLMPLGWSLALSALAVLMFNYEMVPPVHTFHVDLHEHGILLITVMGVSWLITYLLRRQKQIAEREHVLARRTLQLMRWSEQLREVDNPHALLPVLHDLIAGLVGSLGVNQPAIALGYHALEYPPTFKVNSTQQEGVGACLQDNKPLGCGTGRYENLDDLYLPMRAKSGAYGVCLFVGKRDDFLDAFWIQDVQALLDQMGLACERHESARRAQQARELAQNQATRSLFLTSIAHDQRTPLASIMTSASALLEQGERLSQDEIRHYAELIQAESQQVSRLTDNTLTLARLSGEQVQVPMQAESVEDMVASVLQRLRQRKQRYLPKVQVEQGLPLVLCNMVLVEQVLDNLIDNALQHSGAPDSVELNVVQGQGEVCFQVSDLGKGMPLAQIQPGDQSRGLGIGLQLCRAVAQVHSGRLHFSAGLEKGTTAVFCLPIAVHNR